MNYNQYNDEHINSNNNNEQIIDVDSSHVSYETSEIEYSNRHYLNLIIIYFLIMYFGSVFLEFPLLFIYKLIYKLPTSYINEAGVQTPTEHYSTFMNIWLNIVLYIAMAIILVCFLIKLIKNDILRTKTNLKETLKKSGMGILYIYAASFACGVILTILRIDSSSENQSTISKLLTSADTFAVIMYCIVLTFVAPLVEELIFRKTMFNYMRKFNYSTKKKIVITGILFGGIHVATSILVMILELNPFIDIIEEIILGIPYIIMGFIFGYIYSDSDENIAVPFIVHMINNGISAMGILFPILLK